LNFSSNFFEIFSIPSGWHVDLGDLDVRYRALQQEFHPDRYATKSDVEKHLAVQTASLINQAFETLKTPLKRAQYLLELNGVDIDQETHVTTDSHFLMQQIELRETLAGVAGKTDPWAELETLRAHVEAIYQNLQSEFFESLSAKIFDSAFTAVAKMQFFSKLLNEIEQLEADLEDA
jgi:molecular chaperone HscB